MNLLDGEITILEAIFIDWFSTALSCFVVSSILGAIKDISAHKPHKFILNPIMDANQLRWFDSVHGLNKYVDRNPDKGRKRFKFLGMSIKVPVQLTDGFHFFKMLQIIEYTFPAAYMLGYMFKHQLIITLLIWLIIGVVRNSVFSLFYHKIFVSK